MTKVQHSILRKVTVQSIALTSLTAVILTLLTFLLARSTLQQRMYSQLSAVVHEKKELIEQRVFADRQRTAILAKNTNIAVSVLLKNLQEQGVSVTGIALFDARGVRISSAGAEIGSPTKQSATVLVPSFIDQGWEGYSIYSPMQSGTLAMRYNVQDFLEPILSASALGETGEATIGMVQDSNIVLLNHKYAEGFRSPLEVGSLHEALQSDLPMAGALVRHEGISSGFAYDGKKVFAAYRLLPSLGWGLVVSIAQEEAMRGVVQLAYILVTISALLLLASGIVALRLARNVTHPIVALSTVMQTLGPNHWKMKKTVRTGDEVEALEAVAMDMSKRLKHIYDHLEEEIEKQTAELNQQYLKDRTILQTIDYGVIMVDAKGAVTNTNQAALDILQCNEDACMNKAIHQVLDVRRRKKSLTKSRHPVMQCLSLKKTVKSSPELRYSIMRSDNILVPVLLTVKPLLDGKKQLGAIMVFQDVTDHRRVDYLKSEFISLASHQLRTPLSSLQWYIELLADEDMTDEQKEYVAEMNIAGKRMSDLIDALLHAARLESGTIVPHPNSVDLTGLITDLAGDLKTLAKEKQISCEVDVPSTKTMLHTDSVLLHVAFKNLFSNAVKYSKDKGNVEVSLKSTKTHAVIRVKDSGIGIPQAEQDRLFQRLFRASNVRKMDTDGNGLGLYITKMIVDGLHGKIDIKSSEGKGTTVTVKLPLEKKKK